MKSVAELLYFLALRNAFASYLQLDNKDASTLERAEADKTFAAVNCLTKTRVEYENDDKKSSAVDAQYAMIYIAGRNLTREQLLQRVASAERLLADNGAIVFDHANPRDEELNNASRAQWQVVARLRCQRRSFVCVVADVAHGCAVYRPHLKSLPFAAQHITLYDQTEYLQTNRASLLNIVTWEQFQLLIRLF